MKQRTTQPKNNKYYIRIVSGGNNGAVQGSPTAPGADVLSNCVGYCNGRLNESILDANLEGIERRFKYQLVCNAENFIEAAKRQGLKIRNKPTLGGIMVWQRGESLNSWDGAGHVAFVEQINADGSIITSESGWGSYAFRRIKRTNKNGRWGMVPGYKFRGCIVNPSINSEARKYTGTIPTATLRRGKNGKQVKYLQQFLNWYGNSLDVDGIFGPATDSALKSFQRDHNLDPDGIVGPLTKNVIKKYKK